MYQAQCVAYGDSVYQQNDPLSDAQITALQSGKSISQVINNPSLMNPATAPVDTPDGQIFDTDGVVDTTSTPSSTPDAPADTPDVSVPDDTSVSTSTPDIPIDTDTSSTTPIVLDDTSDTSTTTPSVPDDSSDASSTATSTSSGQATSTPQN